MSGKNILKSPGTVMVLAFLCSNLILSTALAAAIENWPNTSTPSYIMLNEDGGVEDQLEPAIVQTSDGDYIVAWSDYRDNIINSDSDIFMKKISAIDGSDIWTTEIAITNQGSSFRNGAPIWLRADDTGGVFIGWTECATIPFCGVNTRNPRVQKVSSGGALLWGPGGVNLGTTTTQREDLEDILPDGSGGLYVINNVATGTVNDSDILVTRLNSSGSVHSSWNTGGSGTFRFLTMPELQANRTEYNGVLTSDGSGNIFVTYGFIHTTDDSLDGNLCTVKLDGSGNMLWGTLGSLPAGMRVIDPQEDLYNTVINDPINEWVVMPDNSGGLKFALALDASVRIAKLNGDGTYDNSANWDDNTGNSFNEGRSIYSTGSDGGWVDDVQAVGDSSGNIYLAYAKNDEIYAQKYNSSGVAQWNSGNEVLISNNTDTELATIDFNDFPTTEIVLDGAGGIYVAWEDYSIASFISRVLSDGTVDMGTYGTPLGVGFTFDYPEQNLAPASGNGAVVVFSALDGDANIYTQYFTSTGAGGGGGGGSDSNAEQNIICDTNGAISISAVTPAVSFVSRTVDFYNEAPAGLSPLLDGGLQISVTDSRGYDPSAGDCGGPSTLSIQSNGLVNGTTTLGLQLGDALTNGALACTSVSCSPAVLGDVAAVTGSTGSVSAAVDIVEFTEAFSGTIRTSLQSDNLQVTPPVSVIPTGTYTGTITFTLL